MGNVLSDYISSLNNWTTGATITTSSAGCFNIGIGNTFSWPPPNTVQSAQAVAPKKRFAAPTGDNEAWLNKRVDDMRVRL